jgi:hypothetical protein
MEKDMQKIIEEARKRFFQINEYTFKGNSLQEDDVPKNDTLAQSSVTPTEQPKNDTLAQSFVTPTEQPDNPISAGGTEEIDVTELTDAQDEIKNKLSIMSGGFDKLFTYIEKLGTKVDSIISHSNNLISATNVKIDDLKQEIEKRNPTEIEKLNLRSLDSAPFTQKPNEYWDEKNREGRYDVYSDNEINPSKEDDGEKEYVLKQDEIDNEPINPSQILKTLSHSNFNANLKDILRY